ncbi:hypothetical protein N7494_013322 [Penicillium frequentans]|uniref:CSC1/OSCA1-like 7TM region domain-containing protein n=1 Tax=Penicillium frequentans TaxID=3151616 RepID=A0AAD6CHV7_9EURO|nr:hypothetical protein N7494_013322 [Penicillium glabrum]
MRWTEIDISLTMRHNPRNVWNTVHSSSNTDMASSSAYAVLSTLIPSLAFFTVEMALFGILRHKQRRLYAHRISSEATSSSGPGLWAWILDLYRQDDAIVLRKHSLDAYFVLRYLQVLRRISFGRCCITWVILLPIHITGSGHQTQLNLLSISNIAEDQYNRYYLHVFATFLLVRFISSVMTVEHIYFVDVTLLTTIGMIYSCIAPLLLGCTCAGLCLLEFAYRYDIFYVRRPAVDTQGLAYIQALQHLMVGCHFLIVCLIALFALATGSHRRAAGPLALMLALLAITILYHRMMKSAMTARIQSPGKNRPGTMDITPLSPGSGLPPLLRKVTRPPPRGLNLDLESSRHNSTEDTVYSHPALSAPVPSLLIPEELVAFSKQEIEKHQPAS